MDTTLQTLLADIERFLEQWAMTPSRFGQLAMNDAKFVSRLREGKDVRTGTADRVREFMRDYRPPVQKKAAEYHAI
jgi:hypothetical protein